MAITKYTSVVEIGSGSVKFMIGYAKDNHPIPVYYAKKRLERPLFGRKLTDEDKKSTINALSFFHHLDNETLAVKVSLDSAVLLLPPLNLRVYQSGKATNVVAPNDIISQVDVSNVHTLIKKESLPNGTGLVDIVPDRFSLDDGTSTSIPPIGRKSHLLRMEAKLHCLPEDIITGYRQLCEGASFRIEQQIVETYASSTFFTSLPNFPETYFYIDIGANITSVAFIGHHQPFASSYIELGGETLTSYISKSLNLSISEANYLKEKFGIQRDDYHYQIPLFVKDGRKIYQKELNRVISEFLEIYIEKLKAPIFSVCQAVHLNSSRKEMAILGGGGSLLSGLTKVLETKNLPNISSFQAILPSVPGANDPAAINLLGAISARSTYRGTLEDNYAGVSTLSRDLGRGE